jgi:hypothetical protein
VARTASALKCRHFFTVMQIHKLARAAEHRPRLCEAPSAVPGLRRRLPSGGKHLPCSCKDRHDAGSFERRVRSVKNV